MLRLLGLVAVTCGPCVSVFDATTLTSTHTAIAPGLNYCAFALGASRLAAIAGTTIYIFNVVAVRGTLPLFATLSGSHLFHACCCMVTDLCTGQLATTPRWSSRRGIGLMRTCKWVALSLSVFRPPPAMRVVISTFTHLVSPLPFVFRYFSLSYSCSTVLIDPGWRVLAFLFRLPVKFSFYGNRGPG